MSDAAILTLVRHGETDANLTGVWHGSTDTELTERGRRQARRVAAYLSDRHADVAAVYASPLRRARDTGLHIAEALDLPLQLEAGLGEYDLGAWEGKTYRELYHELGFWHHIRSDPDYAPHGGESPRQVTERYAAALRAIARAHAGRRVIVVGHGGALSMALGHLLDGTYTEWRRVMHNCAVSELVLEPPSLLSFDCVDHLADL
jgi:broad specificity phosphatase PhoE